MEIVKTINLKKYYKMDNYTVKAVDVPFSFSICF